MEYVLAVHYQLDDFRTLNEIFHAYYAFLDALEIAWPCVNVLPLSGLDFLEESPIVNPTGRRYRSCLHAAFLNCSCVPLPQLPSVCVDGLNLLRKRKVRQASNCKIIVKSIRVKTSAEYRHEEVHE